MPLLGTIASSFATSLSSYNSIASVLVGAGGQSAVDFTSIPNTYKHLQIRGIARETANATQNGWRMQFNADTGSIYGTGQSYYNGSAPTDEFMNTTGMLLGEWPGAQRTSGVFFNFVIDINNYSDSSMYKTYFSYGFYQSFGQGGFSNSAGGIWRNTSALSSIKLFNGSGNNLAQYTRISLYGIAG